jgi:hypothetical protein
VRHSIEKIAKEVIIIVFFLMSSSGISRVLSGYRRLFRAQKKLFGEDYYAQKQAKVAIRDHFEQNRSVTDMEKLKDVIQQIDDAEDMLLHGIAQGKLNEETGAIGTYMM